ncbi:MAG: class I SAM-dependent methyltransferase [Desulfobacterales bacterium]|jgi:SAM-dependent methyltransferase
MKPFCHSYPAPTTAATFDALANEYEVNRLSAWYRSSNEIVLDQIAQNDIRSLLDIGCATGWLLRQGIKRKLIKDGVGIDIAPQMIRVAREAVARQRYRNLEFIHADWENFEFSHPPTAKFDAIVCAHTLHYFGNPLRAMEKIRGHLHHGGRFYLIERDTTGSALTLLWEAIHQRILREPIRFFSSSQLEEMMHTAGFSAPGVLTRLRRLFWRKKMFTSVVIMQGIYPK